MNAPIWPIDIGTGTGTGAGECVNGIQNRFIANWTDCAIPIARHAMATTMAIAIANCGRPLPSANISTQISLARLE